MNDEQELKSILVLDDSGDYRKLLLKHLGTMFKGANITEYDPLAQGAPADDFDWSRFDVLILDYQLNLPGVTGLDIFQKNRQKTSFPATIMLSGAGTEALALKALDYGIYNYLDKQTLGKEVLKHSITDAFHKNRKARERILEQTNHSEAFNKSLFYQKLENQLRLGGDSVKRILLLMDLDRHDQLEEQFGIILRDNVIRHIAKITFEFFISARLHPSITRLGDATIALITDSPGADPELNKLLDDLCKDLQAHSYKYKDRDFDHRVSMGVIRLPEKEVPAQSLIKKAMAAVTIASQAQHNSYQLVPDAEEAGTEPATAEQQSAPPEQRAETDKDAQAAALRIKQAIDEKRMVQTFRPVISLLSDESGAETYYLSCQLIDRDGSVLGAEDIYGDINTPALQQYFDRWMLREALGRIINIEDRKDYFFIMPLSEASLADATLFNWLRKLLTGIEGKHPGKSIALEISAQNFYRLQKPSGALMHYLHNSHGFRFVLSAFGGLEEVSGLPQKANFELVRTNTALAKQLNETLPSGETQGTLLKQLKTRGIRLMCDGIDDSAGLTEAISSGADYAMGSFIGTEMVQLDENKFVESFEIT